MALLNREEVIEALNAEIDFSIESDYDLTKIKPEFQKFADEMIKAQEKAINELEPASDAVPVVRCKNCKHWDSISRQSVIKEILRLWNCSGDKDYCMETLRDFVSELSPVTSERKKAKWVKLYFGSMYDICSECGQRVTTGYFEYNYCPSCGAEMENVE